MKQIGVDSPHMSWLYISSCGRRLYVLESLHIKLLIYTCGWYNSNYICNQLSSTSLADITITMFFPPLKVIPSLLPNSTVCFIVNTVSSNFSLRGLQSNVGTGSQILLCQHFPCNKDHLLWINNLILKQQTFASNREECCTRKYRSMKKIC